MCVALSSLAMRVIIANMGAGVSLDPTPAYVLIAFLLSLVLLPQEGEARIVDLFYPR